MAALARLTLLLVAAAAVAGAAADCTAGSSLDAEQALLARYLYELRNNRQQDCSPPDFVMDPSKAGFSVARLCTEPGTAPTDTYANLTATFKNACKGGDPEQRLSLQALLRTCPGQDPTLQPWEADSVEVAVEPLPANFTCPADLEPIPLEDPEIDFTPMWELQHLCENGVKYRLFGEDPAAVPACGGGAAWLSTTMRAGCYSSETGEYDGYCTIQFSCADGKEYSIDVRAGGTLLPGGRDSCPWPMFLPGSDGYSPEFDFRNKTAPPPGVAPAPSAPGELAACLREAGVAFVDASRPKALDAASKVWNKLNTTVALAVCYPEDADQVAAAVLCAKKAGVKPVPRSGGHSYMGYSVLPDGLTIDLARMNATTVAANGGSATVQAGSRLGQLYYWVFNQTAGAKAAVGGTCPPVGVGGFLQGGGIGPLSRPYGLGCDQLLQAELVDAEGRLVVASPDQNPELLAALCGGGGGNFGVVTQYTIKLYDVPPQITVAQYTVAREQALAFLDYVQSEWLPVGNSSLGLQLNIQAGMVLVTCTYPGPAREARELLVEAGLYGGSWATRDESFSEMRWIDSVVAGAYMDGLTDPAQLLDIPLMEKQYRVYFKLKSFFAMEPLPDAAWRTMMEWQAKIQRYGGYVELDMLGAQSAVAAVPSNATGFVHRGALFSIQYGAEWEREVDTNKVLPIIEGMQAALDPYFAPQRPAYVNYLDVQVGADPLASYYGDNAPWLQSVKTALDPGNLFTANPLAIPAAEQPPPQPAPVPSPAPAPAPAPGSGPAPAPAPSSAADAPRLLAGVLALLGAALLGL